MANILNNLFRQQQGYLEVTDPDKGREHVQKFATITCGHRGELVRVPPNCKPEAMPYALCWGCRRNICLKCDAELNRTNKCVVIEQHLEEMEARERFHCARG